MKLHELNAIMNAYDNTVAYGSECNAWQDFVADCFDMLGTAPFSDANRNDPVPDEMEEYWTDVADGCSDDYDAHTGTRIDR